MIRVKQSLAAFAPITDIVGQRIHVDEATDNTPLDYLVLSFPGGNPQTHLKGATGTVQYRAAIDCWTKTAQIRHNLFAAVRLWADWINAGKDPALYGVDSGETGAGDQHGPQGAGSTVGPLGAGHEVLGTDLLDPALVFRVVPINEQTGFENLKGASRGLLEYHVWLKH